MKLSHHLWRRSADFAKKQEIHKTPSINFFLLVLVLNRYTLTAWQMRWKRVKEEKSAQRNHKRIILATNVKLTFASFSNHPINVELASNYVNLPVKENAFASG